MATAQGGSLPRRSSTELSDASRTNPPLAEIHFPLSGIKVTGVIVKMDTHVIGLRITAKPSVFSLIGEEEDGEATRCEKTGLLVQFANPSRIGSKAARLPRVN